MEIKERTVYYGYTIKNDEYFTITYTGNKSYIELLKRLWEVKNGN